MSESMFPSVGTSTPSELAERMAQAQVAVPQSAGSEFVRMNQQGKWGYGRTDTDCTGDSAVVDAGSFTHGWITWVDRKPTRATVPYYDAVPVKPAPIDGNEPAEQRSVKMLLVDDGTMVTFDTSSYGGKSACDTLLIAIKKRAEQGSTFLYPKIALESSSYKSKQGSTIFNPEFTIAVWLNSEGVEEGQEELEVLDVEVEEEPAKRTRKR